MYKRLRHERNFLSKEIAIAVVQADIACKVISASRMKMHAMYSKATETAQPDTAHKEIGAYQTNQPRKPLMKTKEIIITSLITLLVSTQTMAASFDCKKAGTTVENIICNDE